MFICRGLDDLSQGKGSKRGEATGQDTSETDVNSVAGKNPGEGEAGSASVLGLAELISCGVIIIGRGISTCHCLWRASSKILN